MPRPPASESVNRWIAVSEGSPPPPDKFTTEEEREIWYIYCSARDPRDWRPVDLLTVEILVKREIELREIDAMIGTTGPLVKGKGGRVIANPLYARRTEIISERLRLGRALSIYALPDPRSTAGRAFEAHRTKTAMEAQTIDESNLLCEIELLASPTH